MVEYMFSAPSVSWSMNSRTARMLDTPVSAWARAENSGQRDSCRTSPVMNTCCSRSASRHGPSSTSTAVRPVARPDLRPTRARRPCGPDHRHPHRFASVEVLERQLDDLGQRLVGVGDRHQLPGDRRRTSRRAGRPRCSPQRPYPRRRVGRLLHPTRLRGCPSAAGTPPCLTSLPTCGSRPPLEMSRVEQAGVPVRPGGRRRSGRGARTPPASPPGHAACGRSGPAG